MSVAGPIVMRWEGDAMRPLARFAAEADRRYVIGETYALDEVQERSAAAHSHYFAALHECWLNLPEGEGERFVSEEAFRKWLLIRAGYRDERSIVCATKAEAQRVAAFVKPLDPYAVVTVSEAVVRVWTAQSQSHKAMDRRTFQESKTKVLEIAADLIGISPAQLSPHPVSGKRLGEAVG